jgi:hypothetical protein
MPDFTLDPESASPSLDVDNLTSGIMELVGEEDFSIRPTREPFRSMAIKKYGLPLPPVEPNEEKKNA